MLTELETIERPGAMRNPLSILVLFAVMLLMYVLQLKSSDLDSNDFPIYRSMQHEHTQLKKKKNILYEYYDFRHHKVCAKSCLLILNKKARKPNMLTHKMKRLIILRCL